MKKIFIAALSLFFAAGGPPVSGRQENADPIEGLLRLYQAHRYFELHEALAGMKERDRPGMAFFRAVDASTGNKPDEAIAGFLAYLQGEPDDSPRPLAREALSNLADSYRRSGQYRKAGEAYRLALERFGGELEASERTNYESQAALWSSVADVSPQEVRILKDSDIPMEKRSFPIRVKDADVFVWYDTGASLSVLYESAARDLGCVLRGSGMKIQSGNGRWIESQLTVVPEIRLGNAVVRNAVFLVLPDSFFPVRQIRPGIERRGLIGAPILFALREFAETKDGRLLIPAAPRPRSFQNMRLFGFRPLVEVLHRKDRLSLCLDTGSAQTFLYPPFFRRYRKDIESRSKLREVTIGSVGGGRKVAAHVLDEFAFLVGGLDVHLSKITVHTEDTHTDSALFDGVLGLDVLARCSRMIFNFESMSFVLE
jgi:hypothetical protein